LKKLRNLSSFEGEDHDGSKVDRLLFIEAGIEIQGVSSKNWTRIYEDAV
jgi:hypothetical protein